LNQKAFSRLPAPNEAPAAPMATVVTVNKQHPAAESDDAESTPAGWLFKEEPSHYSFADLMKDGSTLWEGVANPVARKHLRATKAGDRVLYYHTGRERAIVGEMRALDKPSAEDATVVKVAPVRPWPKPVTLEQIKADRRFAEWELVRISRLSVMPVSAEHWRLLEDMAFN
jgi:predicted RNA-binding protein with PUA-like domain